MIEVISVARSDRAAWAVKHRDGFLGHTNSREEATSIGQDLVRWLEGEGRRAELAVCEEPRAFTGPDILSTSR